MSAHASGSAKAPNTATSSAADEITHPDLDHAGWSLQRQGAIADSTAQAVPMAPRGLPGLDVSSYQGDVNWASVASKGAKFAYAKATEGTTYTNPYFAGQYNGPYQQHIIRGAYHFALPNHGTGAAQANYFLAHGGGWSADGRTLPGVLDIEYNPYGSQCYGLSAASMVSWIRSFVTTYHARTTRWPVIYTTANWWRTCTGNSTGFSKTDPLWIAYYGSTSGPLPGGWPFYTIWQYGSSGKFPGDQDVFNGSAARLYALAKG
jgi:GH25 family lysozyme M1 (1,4-beta-N-acetylmuramidase)